MVIYDAKRENGTKDLKTNPIFVLSSVLPCICERHIFKLIPMDVSSASSKTGVLSVWIMNKNVVFIHGTPKLRTTEGLCVNHSSQIIVLF